jgi:DNA-binding NarL/FixJ family response regulator
MKIALFDDSLDVRTGLAMLLNASNKYKLVGSFATAIDCVNEIKYCKPDVVLMDIEMPDVSGIEAVKLLKAAYPEIQIIMQTVFDDDDRVFQSICAGATGYLLKGHMAEKIFDALNELEEGGCPMTPSIALKVITKMKDLESAKTKKIDEYNLSAREKEVLTLIAKGKSHKQICDELFVSYDTVRSHIKKIYSKLHVGSKVEAVSKIIKENLL